MFYVMRRCFYLEFCIYTDRHDLWNNPWYTFRGLSYIMVMTLELWKLDKFTSAQLKTGLEKVGLSFSGTKSEWINRVLSSFNSQSIIGKHCLECNTVLHSMNRGQNNCKPLDVQPMMFFEGVESEFEELADMFGEEIARTMLF